ncbi:MAG: Na/Pi cotransporter family protein [Lachnospiraceae bacterium]|nr:Na/Pi cotransporter family protein [Lachnospiraceae bacterium]
MSMANILSMLGGLALFLYGMQMMSTGLEAAAGNKMKLILEKITANRFVGVLVGAFITAIIQSSSATTVMVVGFVNSGMMTLKQAVWIIMGANIGTTITGQLIALDVGELAPLLAFFGVAGIVFMKNERVHHIGEIIAGLGILFIGMDMMSGAMKPLAEVEEFVGLLSKFENPILGILAGALFTALIQSSSASVGILQALAMSGAVTLHSAAFVLFGQNIGTCVTALLASVGTSRNAKRTTIVHIAFNVFGTVVFTILCLVTPIILLVEGWSPGDVSKQIANLHTLFNIVTTCLLLPIGTVLPKIATFILKDKDEQSEGVRTKYLLDMKLVNVEKIGGAVILVESIKKELNRMIGMTKENVLGAFDVFSGINTAKFDEIKEREEYVDFLNKEISKYITNVAVFEKTNSASQVFNALFTITSNVERIGDHAMNIAEYIEMIEEKKIRFSEQAVKDIAEMKSVCSDLLVLLEETPEDVIEWHEKVSAMEQKIDDLTVAYRNSMFERIQKGSCSDEGSILFSEMLTDFERIGDHALNISSEMVAITIAENS